MRSKSGWTEIQVKMSQQINKKSSQGAKIRPSLKNLCLFNEYIWPKFCKHTASLDVIFDRYKEDPDEAVSKYSFAVNMLQEDE